MDRTAEHGEPLENPTTHPLQGAQPPCASPTKPDVLEALADGTDTSLAYLDAQLNFVWANATYARGSGHRRQDLLGRNHFDLFPNAENQAIFESVRDTGQPVEFRAKPFVFVDQPERGVTYWDWTLTPDKDTDGRVRGLVLSLLDVTDKARAEQERSAMVEALRIQEEQYHQLTEHIQDYVMRYDRAHRHVYANEAAIAVTGKTRAEYIGKTHREMGFPEELCALWERVIDRVFTTGKPHGEIFEWNSAQGQIVLDWRVVPEFAGDEVATVLAVSRDITAIKQTEQTLREQQAELDAIYQNAPILMLLIDGDNRVRRANGFAESFAHIPGAAMVGLRAGEAIGCLHAFDRPPGSDYGPQCAACPLRRAMRDTLETGASHDQVEVSLPFRVADERQELHFLLSTTRLDIADQPLALVSLLDITERMRVEAALKTSEALLAETQRISGVGGWKLDVETGRVAWTEEVYRLHEVPADFDPRLASALGFYPEHDRAITAQAVQRAVETGAPYDLECQLDTATGRRLWVRAIGKAEWQDGRVVRLSGAIQDITARKQAELTLQRAHDELELRVQERTRELTQVNTELLALSETEHRQRQAAETLAAASRALTQSLSLDSALHTLLEHLGRCIPCDSACIMLPQDEVRFGVRAAQGYERWIDPQQVLGMTLDARECSPIQTLLAKQQSILIADTRADSDAEHPLGVAHARNWLGVPLVAGDKVIGICGLDKAEPDFFSQSHVHLAEALVGQAAVAVQNAWLFEQVRAGRERLQFLARRLVEVQETERRYIARELHDEAGQALTSLMVGMRLLEREAQHPEAVIAGVAELRRVADGVLEDLHRLAMDLRPASLDYLGLVAALRQYIEAISDKYGLTAQLETVHFDQRLPSDVETALYRIAQEAITNVVRHAQATRIDVLLEQDDGRLIVIVEDNGIGFSSTAESQGGHLGLLGMHERTEMLGGTLMVESTVGVGTTVRVEVPYGNSHSHRG